MRIKEGQELNIAGKLKETIELPKRIPVELENGVELYMTVEWDSPASVKYEKPETYTISGNVVLKDYSNPLIEQRADPYIYKHIDGYYYFTGSYPLYDRIVLRRAKTIEELSDAEEVVIWEAHGSGIMSKHIWAPELHYINGKWYIHFAAGDKDDVWAIRPYVLETGSDNPLTGKWEEKGQINTDFQSFSLDATTFEHKGKRYLVWAQKVDNDTVSNLYIAEMSNPWTIRGKQVLLATPEYAWEQSGFYVNEGPAMINRNGNVYIAYSGSATDDRYAMGLLIADENSDLLNPKSWEKLSDPVMVSNEKTREYGPGHNSFTVAEDGETDLFVYHARSYKEIEGNPLYDFNRHTRVQELLWRTDGLPYFGKPGQKLAENNPEVKVTITITEN
ncbi:family 43 glycosylhydrolase [Bacillus sp. A301a_S52]|nr:family 43 glycosylhydrolase [Bacillus sp. A301a_S52]